MKSKSLLVCALISLAWARPVHAWELFRSESSAIERGNEHLTKGQHKEALEAYDEAARELPTEPAVQLDRGLALLALGKLGEAREAFRRAGVGTAPKEVRGPALYNLGLAFMQEGDAAAKAEDFDGAKKLLEESVDAFRGSLRAQPNNRDAGWNLELAKRRLADVKQKQEQKKKEEEEKKEQEKKDQDENEQEKNDPQESDQEKPQDGEQQPDGGAPDQGDDAGTDEPKDEPDAGAPTPEPEDDGGAAPPPPSESEGEPDKLPEHMERALDALEAGEENLEKHRARQRARSRPRRVEKDW